MPPFPPQECPSECARRCGVCRVARYPDRPAREYFGYSSVSIFKASTAGADFSLVDESFFLLQAHRVIESGPLEPVAIGLRRRATRGVELE